MFSRVYDATQTFSNQDSECHPLNHRHLPTTTDEAQTETSRLADGTKLLILASGRSDESLLVL